MHTATIHPNPFALMLDSSAIFAALESSVCLSHVKRQIFRPLDKPMIARKDADMAAFDEAVDGDAELSDSL